MNRSSNMDLFALLDAAHSLEARVEQALDQAQLSVPKFQVLSALVEAGKPLALSEVAARLSCVRSNVTQLIDRLETDGLVRRVHCPEDRRSVKAELTDDGRKRQEAGAAAMAALHTEFAVLVPAKDRDALERLLTTLK